MLLCITNCVVSFVKNKLVSRFCSEKHPVKAKKGPYSVWTQEGCGCGAERGTAWESCHLGLETQGLPVGHGKPASLRSGSKPEHPTVLFAPRPCIPFRKQS